MHTYVANGWKNGGAAADPVSNSETFGDLYKGNATTAGVIRLPVCTAEIAWTAWLSTPDRWSEPNYPCIPK